jgi:hypothetical protein
MEHTDRLKKMQDELYSREPQELSPLHEHTLHENAYDVKKDFDNLPEPPAPDTEKKLRIPISFVQGFLIFSVVFFLIAAFYTYYTFSHGSNLVSSNNIDIGISGPVSSPGGEKLALDVTLTNRNKANLRFATLIVDYPKGTRKADNTSVELTNDRIYIGDISVGEIVRKHIESVLFGEEKSVADIKFTLEYSIPNSNAIFSKEVPYDVIVSSNPLALIVDAPKETVSGQDMTITLSLRSNTSDVLKNVIVAAQYPAGFVFKSSTVSPLQNKNTWKLGDMKPGDQKTIAITGTLAGEDGDSRVFRFQTGLGNGADADVVATPFSGFKQEIAIKKPFIQLAMAINGSSDTEVVAKKNNPIHVSVKYSNNLPVSVNDVSITVNLSGAALDKSGVVPDQGFYQSVNNAVVWDKSTNPTLAALPPGATGELGITITPNQTITGGTPSIILSGSVTGKRVEEGKVPETVNASVNRTIKIESDLSYTGNIYHFTGPISNTGPIPPRAEKETTYTVTWMIGNGINDITDAVVKAELPSYVRYIGNVVPGNETITYNADSKVVMWDVGTVKSLQTGSARTVSFKVGLTPSVSQVGKTVDIVKEANFTGNDRFTGTQVVSKVNALTSKTDDNQYKSGDDIVAK